MVRNRTLFSAMFCALVVSGAHAQLSDGDFDGLAVGTPPDNAAPAGGWQFPANYIAGLAGEFDPSNYTIVATSSFGGGSGGNSLSLNMNDAVNNVHLTNLLTGVINEAPGLVVHAKFRVWVAQAGQGGGAIYFGADMGGGGFANTLDRGPQIIWLPNGTFNYANGAGVNTPLVPAYPVGQWQQVVLHIRLDVDNYDVEWGPEGSPLTMVGTNLPFRSAPLNKLDRFSFAHFGATSAQNVAFYDDIGIGIEAPPCYPDCNGDNVLNLADFGCFQTAFAGGNMYADCNGDLVLNLADFGCFQTSFAAGCP